MVRTTRDPQHQNHKSVAIGKRQLRTQPNPQKPVTFNIRGHSERARAGRTHRQAVFSPPPEFDALMLSRPPRASLTEQ